MFKTNPNQAIAQNRCWQIAAFLIPIKKNKYIMKTPMQQLITFISSEDYKELYPNLKIEWFEIFINKEKELIKHAFQYGELVNERPERFDNCQEDNAFNNWKEYYEYKFGNSELLQTTS